MQSFAAQDAHLRRGGGASVDLSARALLTEPDWGADRKTADFDSILVRTQSLKVVYSPANMPAPSINRVRACDDPDKVVYLAFTSGTSGTPKCVMHSDNTLLANARDLVRDWGHGPETTIFSISPLSHHIAWVGVAQWLLTGGRFVTDDPPPGKSRIDWIRQSGATYVLGVPTHAMDILNDQKRLGSGDLNKVSVFIWPGRRFRLPSPKLCRAGHPPPERLRNDGEFVAPVHSPNRSDGGRR